jgi:hypothetical protein
MVFFHAVSTFTLDSTLVFLTKNILPDAGIFCRRILHPVQPALLAIAERGFLLSTISGTKKCLGMTKNSIPEIMKDHNLVRKNLGYLCLIILTALIDMHHQLFFYQVDLSCFSVQNLPGIFDKKNLQRDDY